MFTLRAEVKILMSYTKDIILFNKKNICCMISIKYNSLEGHGLITDCYIHHNVVLKLFRKIQNKCKTSALSDYLWRAIFQISFPSTM